MSHSEIMTGLHLDTQEDSKHTVINVRAGKTTHQHYSCYFVLFMVPADNMAHHSIVSLNPALVVNFHHLGVKTNFSLTKRMPR